ncbi:virion structural protein [Synechococcus phage S-SZBM1]|uniref:Virion structural protein n=1 Tax=Synechococcus phage S-SZBM1 TaxID=2926475 RepID=A0AC61TSQ4_9CAUD|nr:virion structural protein [Synechococcus phage S-SZBM1]UNH61253.1 virion structural protein [Synechococcus phage S-SZBM1]
MSLYGRTDSNANKAKIEALRTAVTAGETIVFVDETEAALSENKERGINGPGWWSYRTYTDGSGKTRHKAEMLAFIANPDLNANETQLDDAIAADVASLISISVQPVDVVDAADPFTGTFSVTASADAGNVVYQWQRQSATGTRWTNITDGGVFSGATTATLTLTAADKLTYDGYKFRVKLTSDAGAEEVISDMASITYL